MTSDPEREALLFANPNIFHKRVYLAVGDEFVLHLLQREQLRQNPSHRRLADRHVAKRHFANRASRRRRIKLLE